MDAFANPDDAAIEALLKRVGRIAVVGLSPKPHRDSNRVARYLLDHGYDVVPVYPRESQIFGRTVYRTLADVPGPVDLVNVFRNSDHVADVVAEALAARAPALWLQLGCIDASAARLAVAAGVTVVMDRCIMVDHARILDGDWRSRIQNATPR